MTETWEPGLQVSELPPYMVTASSSGQGPGFLDFGAGLQDEPYLVLRGEDRPDPGTLLLDGVWALITVDGEPAAFVSPDVVRELPLSRPVRCVIDDLSEGYVADFGLQPTDFFRSRLGRPRTVRGRVFVLSRNYALRGGPTATLTEFDNDCDYGTILGIGEICDDDCSCDRRNQ